MDRALPRLSTFAAALIAVAIFVVGPAEGSTGMATYDRALSPQLSGWDDERLVRRANESDLAFAERATTVVSDAIWHCEPTEPQSLLAWFQGHPEGVLAPEHLRCGFCSQISWVLAETLKRGGIESAYVLGLDGHVVTTFTLGTTAYVADADFGVPPFEVVWSDSEQVERQIRERFPITDPVHMERVVDIFTDTSTDGPYIRGTPAESMANLRSIADHQSRTLGMQEPLAVLLAVTSLLALLRVRRRASPPAGK